MKLEIKENNIVIDDNPIINNLGAVTFPAERLIRIKMNVLTDDEMERLDLSLYYPRVSPKLKGLQPKLQIELEGRELIRDIGFKLILSINLLGKLSIQGNIGKRNIDTIFTDCRHILAIIKSAI